MFNLSTGFKFKFSIMRMIQMSFYSTTKYFFNDIIFQRTKWVSLKCSLLKFWSSRPQSELWVDQNPSDLCKKWNGSFYKWVSFYNFDLFASWYLSVIISNIIYGHIWFILIFEVTLGSTFIIILLPTSTSLLSMMPIGLTGLVIAVARICPHFRHLFLTKVWN